MEMKIILTIIILLILAGVGSFVYQYYFVSESSDESVACTMEAKLCPDGSYVGRVAPSCEFEECPEPAEKADLIRVSNPKPNQEIENPLIIEGEAKGTWFFEGDFPVVLVDWDGLIIAQSYATAQSDWMTEDFVKFKAEIKFEKPELYNRGALILQKDNPSGLPENNDALEIPIFFK